MDVLGYPIGVTKYRHLSRCVLMTLPSASASCHRVAEPSIQSKSAAIIDIYGQTDYRHSTLASFSDQPSSAAPIPLP